MGCVRGEGDQAQWAFGAWRGFYKVTTLLMEIRLHFISTLFILQRILKTLYKDNMIVEKTGINKLSKHILYKICL